MLIVFGALCNRLMKVSDVVLKTKRKLVQLFDGRGPILHEDAHRDRCAPNIIHNSNLMIDHSDPSLCTPAHSVEIEVGHGHAVVEFF